MEPGSYIRNTGITWNTHLVLEVSGGIADGPRISHKEHRNLSLSQLISGSLFVKWMNEIPGLTVLQMLYYSPFLEKCSDQLSVYSGIDKSYMLYIVLQLTDPYAFIGNGLYVKWEGTLEHKNMYFFYSYYGSLFVS